ncbi:MAG: membrane protein insertion efficiency factor YidD [Proteobacteria bacterium]|nr:MAG: membrane protein insertion efficiency factor YidD [Pseudomonadota bacterium]
MRKIVILLIRGYQLLISSWLPPSCRFTPSCSQYAIIAFSKYGIIKGFSLTIRRILRCNPFGGSGHDPVP